MSAKYLFVYSLPATYREDQSPPRCSAGGDARRGALSGRTMDVTERILSEYREFPGLTLTTRQAARLWALNLPQCERLLSQLVIDGHLFVDSTGQFRWRDGAHRTHPRPFQPSASDAEGDTEAGHGC